MGEKLLKAMSQELLKIKSPDLKRITEKILLDCCDYNAVVPASTTGKYHPAHDLGEGGLVRHTKVVCKLIETIMKMWPQYDDFEWDIPYISCILHDFCKVTSDNQEHSHSNHPLLMAEKIRKQFLTEQLDYHTDFNEINKSLEKIAYNVSCHMSRWNTDRDGNKCGENPRNMENAFVAIADMISAQKFVNINFSNGSIVEV